MDVGLSELDIMQPDHAAVATTAKSKHDSNQIQSQVKVLPILRLAFTFQVKCCLGIFPSYMKVTRMFIICLGHMRLVREVLRS